MQTNTCTRDCKKNAPPKHLLYLKTWTSNAQKTIKHAKCKTHAHLLQPVHVSSVPTFLVALIFRRALFYFFVAFVFELGQSGASLACVGCQVLTSDALWSFEAS